jgi:hypothetical protein
MLVSEDELGPFITTRVQYDPTVTDDERTANIASLDTFMSRQEKFLADMRGRRGTPSIFLPRTAFLSIAAMSSAKFEFGCPM